MMELRDYALRKIISNPKLKLGCDPISNIICFYCADYPTETIRKSLYTSGNLMISSQKVDGKDCFRLVINSMEMTVDIIDQILNYITG